MNVYKVNIQHGSSHTVQASSVVAAIRSAVRQDAVANENNTSLNRDKAMLFIQFWRTS